MKRLTVWIFLSLLSPTILPSCRSTSEPGFDWRGLLTDEELRTDEDPDAPAENEQWATWAAQNNVPIRSLDAENFSDLLALRPFFEGKRIVQLGENGHGVAEFSKVKVRLTKFLHEVMGFNVIAFESSLYECIFANDLVPSLDPEQVMAKSIADVWHTKEVLPLFEYLRQRRSVGAGLRLAGFDIRISSPLGVESRPEFLRQILSAADEDFSEQVFDLDTELIARRWDKGYIAENADSLSAEYGQVVDFIDQHRDSLSASFSERPEVVPLARQVARSIIAYIDHVSLEYAGRDDEAFERRDEGMAENLEFLMNEMFPEEKIIVWAHNAHVCHDYESMPERQRRNMGGRILALHRTELYTVGLYMYRGAAADNDRSTHEVPRSESGSVESILYRTRRKHCFIDMLGQTEGDGDSWAFETVKANEWSHGTISLVPRNQYDALIFVDTVNPPDYVGN